VNSASPPVTGTFDLAWSDYNWSGVKSTISAANLKKGLEALSPDFGSVQVIREGNCFGYMWTIQWLTGGYKQRLNISSNSLQGNRPKISVNELTKGGALLSPIDSDILYTYHKSKPQLTVVINGIASKCSDVNGTCDFTWLSETPIVVGIDTSDLPFIIITGSGLSYNNSENVIKLGENSRCVVYNSSSTEITCRIEDLVEAGNYEFSLSVTGVGLANVSTSTSIILKHIVDRVWPVSSAAPGGGLMHITGSRFGINTTVTLDGLNCEVKFFNYSQISCVIPSNVCVFIF